MSGDLNKALAAAKKRLAEEERKRQEHAAWKLTPAGQHGQGFGAKVGPWLLEVAEGISTSQKVPVAALHIMRSSIRQPDPADWPCGRGEFEATVHRFPDGTVERGFKGNPYLVGCRCPPPDSWGLVIGSRATQDGLLSYGIVAEAGQFWFVPADLGDVAESAHYFDGSRDHDQIAPGEVVVHVFGARDDSHEHPDHPCNLGSFAADHTTNFFLPLRGSDFAFRATLEGFFAGQPLAPQFRRKST
jgi:hypothetical protein